MGRFMILNLFNHINSYYARSQVGFDNLFHIYLPIYVFYD
jgi:hypothetical protein